eukprot:scaffold1875_cov253-Pinguiococcus_pyrenoidosus.AAC.27
MSSSCRLQNTKVILPFPASVSSLNMTFIASTCIITWLVSPRVLPFSNVRAGACTTHLQDLQDGGQPGARHHHDEMTRPEVQLLGAKLAPKDEGVRVPKATERPPHVDSLARLQLRDR